MKAALFCIGNIALLSVAVCWSASLTRRRLDFAVGVAALFPLCASLIVLVCGLAGLLTAVTCVLLASSVALVLSVRAQRRSAFTFLEGRILPRSIPGRIAATAAVAFALVPLVRVLTAGTGYFIDDFGYHAVAVAAWLQHGDFRQIMPQFMAYLPLNAELLSAWFALPYHQDAMVVLASLAWLALAALATGALARLSGGDVIASIIAATAVMSAPPVLWQTRTFSGCDLAGTATLLGSIYFAVSALRNGSRGQAILAGMLGGFAAGTKATFLPVTILICLFPLCLRGSWRQRWSFATILSISAAAVGSVWYVQNWVNTGNPLFPASVGPFAGPLTPAEQAGIKLVGLVSQVPWTPRLWGHMIYDYLDWPLPLGLLAFAGYVRTVWCECAKPARDTGDRILPRLLWICGIAQFTLHLFAPFCLGGGYVDGHIEVYSRYVMPWFAFGLVLATPLLDSRSRLAWAWRALAVSGFVLCWPRSGFMQFAGPLLAIAVVLVVSRLPLGSLRTLALVGGIALWPMLTLLEPRMRSASERNLREHLGTAGGKSLGKAFSAIDSLPPGSRVTRFANHSYLNAPAFGRDWQLRPVFTDADGVALTPLHARFQLDPTLTFFGQQSHAAPTAHALLRNLRTAGIQYVFVTKYGGAEWPPQQAFLRESHEAAIIYDDGDSTLWQLQER